MEFKHVTDKDFASETGKGGTSVFFALLILAEVAVCALIVLGKLGADEIFPLLLVGVVTLGLVLILSIVRKDQRNERYEQYLGQLSPAQLDALRDSGLDKDSKTVLAAYLRKTHGRRRA